MNGASPVRTDHRWLRISLLVLPYLPQLGALGLLALTVRVLWQHRGKLVKDWLTPCLLAIALLFLLSSLTADNKLEALIQLANFLPFFAFFIALQFALTNLQQLEQLAIDLVLTALPLNLIGILEFGIKSLRKLPLVEEAGWSLQWLGWPEIHEQDRAISLFIHPNLFASYATLILGLGLGLVLRLNSGSDPADGSFSSTLLNKNIRLKRFYPELIYTGTFINLITIFCSGSRNALATAVFLLILFSLLLKNKRKFLLIGWGLVLLLGIGVMVYGFGGRRISWEFFSRDPRFGIWQIAVSLIQERPWLGWGLGNFKFLYPPRLIDPNYPYIAHPHNFWLLLGVETGLPATLALSAIVGYICYRGVRCLMMSSIPDRQQAILYPYLLAFTGCIGFALFDITLYDVRINAVSWLALGAIHWLTHHSKLGSH